MICTELSLLCANITPGSLIISLMHLTIFQRFNPHVTSGTFKKNDELSLKARQPFSRPIGMLYVCVYDKCVGTDIFEYGTFFAA